MFQGSCSGEEDWTVCVDHFGDMGVLKARKKMARLFELKRLLQFIDQAHPSAVQFRAVANSLISKLRLGEEGWSLRVVVQKIQEAKGVLSAQAEALRRWRLISDYWLDFWNTVEREGPSLQDICEHVLRDTPAVSLHSWVAPGAEELRKVASAMRGASGGDGWDGDELSCLPAGIWDIFARVSDRWLQSGCLPEPLLHARTAYLVKEHKMSNGKPRSNHEKETDRIALALERLRVLGSLRLNTEVLGMYISMFCLSVVSYGWMARLPTWGVSNKLWAAAKRAQNAAWMSNKWLCAVMLGGNSHVDVGSACGLYRVLLQLRRKGSCVWNDVKYTPLWTFRKWLKERGSFIIFAPVGVSTVGVVTGFFCEHAFEMARSEKDSLIQEFENFMQDEHLQAYLSHLNVDPDNAWQIFRLIDSNKDGSVTLEELLAECVFAFLSPHKSCWQEFTTGLLTMKGPAKAIDVKGIVYDVKKEAKKTKRRMKRIDARLRDIKSQIDARVRRKVQRCKDADMLQNESYMNGFPIGVQKDGKYYLYNHLKLDLKYHSSDTYEGHRIVGFEIEPRSVVQATQADPTKPGGLKAVCQEGADAQLMELDMFNEVIFSYDVTWEYSEVRWVSRWDNYLKMTGGQIHWFSILNSLMIMLFLSGMVAMILLRTLYRDITKYNELATAEEAAEETGWKLVHGDVFRKPRFGKLLAVSVGSGVQILGMSIVTLIFALLGFLSPAHRGGLLQSMMMLFTFMGVFGGYASARLYKVFNGEDWKTNTLMTAMLYPGVIFMVFFVLNLFIWGQKSSGAVPFTTMFAILVLWFGISVPLVFLGSYFGFRREAIELPVRTNHVPRLSGAICGLDKMPGSTAAQSIGSLKSQSNRYRTLNTNADIDETLFGNAHNKTMPKQADGKDFACYGHFSEPCLLELLHLAE
eukprot:s1435_g8.t1